MERKQFNKLMKRNISEIRLLYKFSSLFKIPLYVFIRNYFNTEEIMDEVEDEEGVIMVERLNGCRVPLSPDLLPIEINSVSEQIKRIKYKLCK